MEINKQSAIDFAEPLVKRFEGCKLEAYQDIVGVWTIGYGETKGVKKGDVWTQKKADTELRKRLGEFADDVLKACPNIYKIDPRCWGACISLAYNIGASAFAKSSIAKNINNEAYTAASNAILLYNKAGGKTVQGLVNRRNAEKNLFDKGLKENE